MPFDLVIQNGTVVTAEAVIEADLAVQEGKIAALGSQLEGKQVWDAQGCLIIPGGVDTHVHPQMPYGSEWTSDTWLTASRAAACGGTTTLIDFVEPAEGQSLLEALEQRLSLIGTQAYVDYSLHMTVTSSAPSVVSQIQAVVERGVPSFKVYTTYPGFALNDDDLLVVFEAVQTAGGLALVHAENDAILRWRVNQLRRSNRLAPHNYPLSRPTEAEAEAVQRVIWLAKQTGTPLLLVHLTNGESLGALRRARSLGQPVFGETCPQYLLLDESRYTAASPLTALGYVCAPPLRPKTEQDALWQGLNDNTLQTIGSDHCAFHLHSQKQRGLEDFTLCPPGLPGVEARLSLIYTYGVCTRRITLNQWVNLCCTQPARLFGLYPRKGSLEVGSDADLVLFDPRRTLTLTSQNGATGYTLHEGIDYTPYEGMTVNGWPSTVFLRGRPIVTRFQPVSPAASGQFVPRSPFNPYLKGGAAHQETV